MRRSTNSLLLITICVLSVLLGHDVVMAMNPHDSGSAPQHHLLVEECGPDHQSAAQVPVLPTLVAPLAQFVAPALDVVLDTLATDQIDSLADASMLRAMLQVYLN